MGTFLHYIGQYWIPALIILMALAIVLVVKFIASRYKKVPPNAVGIFYGRKYKDEKGNAVGFKVLSGGGRVLLPLVENFQTMSTAAFQLQIDEKEIPNADNVKMSIDGIATCKISTTPEDLHRAVAAFLGKSDVDIARYVQNILKGHLRSIVGKLTIEELFRRRDEFNKNVVAESATELQQLGIQVVNLVVTNVNDELGYIDALGKRAVSQTKAEAEIKVAEAERDQNIKVAQAKKASAIEVSNAEREAAIVRADNEAKVAEAERDRDIKTAEFKAQTDTKRAAAEQAFAIANAAQEQTLLVAEAQRDAASKEAQIEVQRREAARREEELKATLLKQAEADKLKMEIDAEAQRKKTIIDAEAEAQKLRTTAEAKKLAATAEGEGQAAAQRAILLATAEGKAAEKKQALLAEAEGTQKLADALKEMTEASRMIIILDKLPLLFDKGGDATAKVMAAIFGAVAAPIGQIDNISIVDMGGSNGTGGVDKIASIVPSTVAKVFALAKAQGLDLTTLFSKLGVDPSGLAHLMQGGGTHDAPPTTPTK